MNSRIFLKSIRSISSAVVLVDGSNEAANFSYKMSILMQMFGQRSTLNVGKLHNKTYRYYTIAVYIVSLLLIFT